MTAMAGAQQRQRSWRSAGALVTWAALLLLAVAAHAKTKKVSDYFNVCRRSDPDFAGCVKRSIEEAKPRLVKGMPEVRLPSIDPLRIDLLELREGEGNFQLVMRMRNLSVSGLRDFAIKSVRADLQRGEWNLHMHTPLLHFESKYEMQGRMLALPIQGNGDCIMDFYGVTAISDIQMENRTRDGKLYTRVKSLKWNIDVEKASSNFTNLFNGDKTLGETTNKFLNENWRAAFDTYKHLPAEAFAQFFTELENRFFDQFPFNELYPE